MKNLRLTIVTAFYLSRFSELCELVSYSILDIKRDAENQILPRKQTMVKMIKQFEHATIFLNKAVVLSPAINVANELEIRDEISEFIYN